MAPSDGYAMHPRQREKIKLNFFRPKKTPDRILTRNQDTCSDFVSSVEGKVQKVGREITRVSSVAALRVRPWWYRNRRNAAGFIAIRQLSVIVWRLRFYKTRRPVFQTGHFRPTVAVAIYLPRPDEMLSADSHHVLFLKYQVVKSGQQHFSAHLFGFRSRLFILAFGFPLRSHPKNPLLTCFFFLPFYIHFETFSDGKLILFVC